MFDGIPQSNPVGEPGTARTSTRIGLPVAVAIVLALLGMVFTVMLPGDFSEGFHIEFIGP